MTLLDRLPDANKLNMFSIKSAQYVSGNPEPPPSVRILNSHWLVELKECQTLSPVTYIKNHVIFPVKL